MQLLVAMLDFAEPASREQEEAESRGQTACCTGLPWGVAPSARAWLGGGPVVEEPIATVDDEEEDPPHGDDPGG